MRRSLSIVSRTSDYAEELLFPWNVGKRRGGQDRGLTSSVVYTYIRDNIHHGTPVLSFTKDLCVVRDSALKRDQTPVTLWRKPARRLDG